MRLTLHQKLEAAHDDSVWAAHWSPTENLLATGSVDESVKLWQDSGEGLEQKHHLLGLELGVVSVAIDGTGQYGAASSMDSTINVWSQADYSSAARFKLPPAEAWSVAWLPPSSDGRLTLAVAGGSSNTVSLLDVSAQLAGGEAPRPVTLHMPPPPAVLAGGARQGGARAGLHPGLAPPAHCLRRPARQPVRRRPGRAGGVLCRARVLGAQRGGAPRRLRRHHRLQRRQGQALGPGHAHAGADGGRRARRPGLVGGLPGGRGTGGLGLRRPQRVRVRLPMTPDLRCEAW
ncbi:hypothetical protein ACKKBF_B33805 [Auxenochlorella protothecoides x Auxenochlorella symbiontica]